MNDIGTNIWMNITEKLDCLRAGERPHLFHTVRNVNNKWQWKVNNIMVRNKRRNYCESNNLSAFPGKMYQSHVFRLIGGSKGEGIRDLHPLSVQFLSVSCIFCQKSCLIIGFWPKSRGWRPRLGNPGSTTDTDDILSSWTDFGVNLLLTA